MPARVVLQYSLHPNAVPPPPALPADRSVSLKSNPMMPTPTPHTPSAGPVLGRSYRLVAAFACAGGLLFAAARAADPAPPAQTSAPGSESVATVGSIKGRVFNAASGTYLNNARVVAKGTAFQAFTNERGEFLLRNVPVGTTELVVSYAGQNDLREVVIVSAAGTAEANFTFNASVAKLEDKAVMLDTFVVAERRIRNAQELATNEERASTNIKSVIATDTLGYVRDGNIGEFVKFLPGIDVSNGDLGAGTNPDNATLVAMRGFSADTTQVLVDGMPLASGSPGSLTRATQLDAVSINNANRIEIIRVATPDMSSDAPGGSINLISRGAFELANAQYQAFVAFNGSSLAPDVFKKTPGPYEPNYKTLPSVRLAGSIPITKRFGVSFAVSSDSKYSLTQTSNQRDWLYNPRNTLGSGTLAPVANANGGIRLDNPLIERIEIVENQWIEHRQSGQLRLDFLPVDGLEIRLNGQFSLHNGTGVNRRTQWRYGSQTDGRFAVKDWGDGYVTGYQRTATYIPAGMNASMTVDAKDREGFTSQGYLTVKYRKGPWAIDASATASESYTNSPDMANRHFSSVDGNITPGRMDWTGISQGQVGEIKLWNANGAPVNYGDLSTWDPVLIAGGTFRARSSQSANRDLTKQYKLDVARELDFLRFPVTVKAGALQNVKSNRRFGLGATYERRYTGPQIANADIESEYTSEARFGYATPQHWVDPHKIYEIFEAHPEYFTDNLVSAAQNVNLPAINYLSRVGTAKGLTETSTEWYGMATARLFHRLTLITGARQARKELKGYNVFNDPTYQFVKMPDGTLYRDDVYPFGVRFDGNDNASYPTGDPRRAANVVMTDAALRARMTAAGVGYLPTQLELAPNGTRLTNMNQNLFMAMRARTTRAIDAAQMNPWAPQVQLAYDISDNWRAQLAWSKEHRLPDLEGSTNTYLIGGADFQITENLNPTADPGGDGTIRLANLSGKPEINESWNFKLSYYPKNGAGKYSVAYYYKTVDNAWQSIDMFNTDGNYESFLTSMGLSAADYPNYKIQTVLPLPGKQTRKGLEIELSQNFGIIAPWARGVDAFLTYTRRPVVARFGGEAILGWIPVTPVRAKWTGGLSYSMRRFQIQGRFTFTEAGITHGSATNVTLPDGTTAQVQFYNHNKVPPEVNVQANYVLNKNFMLFATANRIVTGTVTSRVSDAETGYLPDWASWRQSVDRGVAFSAGVSATF
jgi:iron complex outermembrane receptor protein